VANQKFPESLFREINHPRKRAFLVALAKTGVRAEAARMASVDRTVIYTPAWRDDAAFQEALRRADLMAADIIEAEIHRRAVEGVDEPVGWYRGEAGGTVRRYSDNLLMFRAKALMPEKYRERVEVRSTVTNIDLTQLPDRIIDRLRRGESPLSVLGSYVESGGILPQLPPRRDVSASE
jgi:hypothetical protein